MSDSSHAWLKGFITPDKILYLVGLAITVAVTLHTLTDRIDNVKEQLTGLAGQVQSFNARTEGVEKTNVKITTQLDYLIGENEARAKEWKLFRELIGNQDTAIAVIRDRIERERKEH